MTTQGLSLWGEAIVAAVTGNADVLRELLSVDDSTGIDIRTFRTSYADVDFIWEARRLRIEPNYTLIEIAVERDHFDVVMVLTDTTPQASQAEEKPRPLFRSVSTFVPASLGVDVRDHVAQHLVVVPEGHELAGLVTLRLPEGSRQTFVLPAEILQLPEASRQPAFGTILEDTLTQQGVDAALGWWNRAAAPYGELFALYTSGDGNCLLHASALATVGVRDTREAQEGEPGGCTMAELQTIAPRRTLRAALHHSLVRCQPLRQLLDFHGALLDGGVDGTAATAKPDETLEARSSRHCASCDPGHLLILAHILRRPIVCYAHANVGEVRDPDEGRSFSSYAAKGERMSGVYLPMLISPADCIADPIAICYTQGHFSAVVSSEQAACSESWRALGLTPPPDERAAVPLPLVDESLAPLPVLFPVRPPGATATDGAVLALTAGREAHERDLLERYLAVREAVLKPPPSLQGGGRGSDGDGQVCGGAPAPPAPAEILVTAQRMPTRGAEDGAAPADTFYEEFVRRRMEAVELSERSEQLSREPSELRAAGGGDGSKGLSYDEYLVHRTSTRDLAAAIAASLQEQ